MCDKIEIKNLKSCEVKMGAMIEWIRKKPDEPSYYDKMVYLKNNWKALTKDCKTIQVSWPSFGVSSLLVRK